MDRADAEIQEEYFMGKSNWSVGVLRRSWWIGKQVAIAGAAIASAPVIIPPLFVLSTLGLALSFPFGIYLAGYVCADKFMSVLLPLPLLKEEVDNESLESEDLRDRGFDADQGDEMVLDEEKWDKGEIIEDESEEGGLLEFGKRNGPERPAVELDVESEVKEVNTREKTCEKDERAKSVELMNDAGTVEELRKSDFANSANEVVGVQLVDEEREDRAADTESSGSPRSPYTAVVLAPYEESNKKEYEPPNLSSEHLSIVELRAEGKADDALVKKELREDGGEEEKRLSVANGVVAKDKELPEECSTERTHNEERLWDQIFSIRAIVGYKATLQNSLGKELMALYLLIGVEPPVSLKDATDLAEISNSLQFLKTVVGVK